MRHVYYVMCEVCKQVKARRRIDGKPNCTRPFCYQQATKAYYVRIGKIKGEETQS